MTVFTGWHGWAIFITACVAAWLLAATGIAALYHLAKTAYQRRQRRLDQLIHDEQARIDRIIMAARTDGERLHGGDTGHCPRCLIGRNDNYLPIVIPCPEHKPAGRHHYTAPVHGPEPVVAEPDFDEWVDEWNRRYAE